MSSKEYEYVSEEELETVVPTAYRTADFEFVAFALAYKKPEVQVVQLIEYDDPQRIGFKARRFMFVLIGSGKDPDWYQKLEALAYEYINGKTLIEPMVLGAKRKFLRGLMYNHPSFHGSRTRQKQKQKDS